MEQLLKHITKEIEALEAMQKTDQAKERPLHNDGITSMLVVYRDISRRMTEILG
jgi:hypothetical protein